MKKNIFLLAHKLGIDGAIAFTVLSRLVQSGGSIISLLFIVRCLSKIEQGYYYTFGSILAIQIFFELGMSFVITQFVAHENASLVWIDDYRFTGNEESVSRLSSLLRFSVKWFLIIGILLFIGLLIVGFIFFNNFGNGDDTVEWKIPWIILALTNSMTLVASPILGFLEGLGKVKQVAKVRFFQQVVQLAFVWLFFSLGFKLFSSPIAGMLAFAIILVWIFLGQNYKLLRFVWEQIGDFKVNYKLEIFPFQWKIALSTLSGYFIFQLFNPVIFATEGAIVAGQMGITLAILNAVLMFSLSWITTKVPTMSGFIAKKDFKALDKLFQSTLLQSTILNALALTIFMSLIFGLRYFNIYVGRENFANRFLPFLPMVFMSTSIFLNHIIAALATYLRCHKEEPMLVQSIVIGILCSISTITLGTYFGIIGMTFGYMILTIISFIWTYFIFKTKKNEWHNE